MEWLQENSALALILFFIIFVLYASFQGSKRRRLEAELKALKWTLVSRGILKGEAIEKTEEELSENGTLPPHELEKMVDEEDENDDE